MRHFSLVYVADGVTSLCPLSPISDIGALGRPAGGLAVAFPVPCYIGDFNH